MLSSRYDQQENKSTALFHMGDAGLDDMLAVLIEHGADVSIRNKVRRYFEGLTTNNKGLSVTQR